MTDNNNIIGFAWASFIMNAMIVLVITMAEVGPTAMTDTSSIESKIGDWGTQDDIMTEVDLNTTTQPGYSGLDSPLVSMGWTIWMSKIWEFITVYVFNFFLLGVTIGGYAVTVGATSPLLGGIIGMFTLVVFAWQLALFYKVCYLITGKLFGWK